MADTTKKPVSKRKSQFVGVQLMKPQLAQLDDLVEKFHGSRSQVLRMALDRLHTAEFNQPADQRAAS